VSAGGPYGVVVGHTARLSASGSDPSGSALVFAWDLAGDGTYSTPGQQADFTDTSTPGGRSIGVLACNGFAVCAFATTQVNVANTPPTVDAGGPYSVLVGGSLDLVATANDPLGGALTFAWDLTGNGTFDTPGQRVTFTDTATAGPRTVGVQVCDNFGLCATATTEVTIFSESGGGGCTVDCGPGPGATPELDSLLLFGGGLAGIAAYLRRRLRHAQSEPEDKL
jgi:hypothetical protein